VSAERRARVSQGSAQPRVSADIVDAPLGAPLPLWLPGANLDWRGGLQSSDMTCRETGAACVIASVSEAIQGGSHKNLNCFLAVAPRNDKDSASLRASATYQGFSFSHTRMLRPSRPSVKFLEGAEVMVSVSPSIL
jgi:hypothetical protein